LTLADDHYVDSVALPTITETSPTPLQQPKSPWVVSKFLLRAVCEAQPLPYVHYEYGSQFGVQQEEVNKANVMY
jgi:hypothetical protein